MIFIDTNILLDVIVDDPVWADWSQQQLDAATLRDRLAVNPIVYAELSGAFARVEELDGFLSGAAVDIIAMSRQMLFLAGTAFKIYRRRGGTRAGVLPDFLIGAQAVVVGGELITRDAARYRSYFPTIELLAPQ
jgi:predicted nucleic acid-binding protein